MPYIIQISQSYFLIPQKFDWIYSLATLQAKHLHNFHNLGYIEKYA